MVHNEFVKCNVCDKIFRLRWQIGYSQAFIKTLCPNCKSHFEIVLSTDSEHKSKYCNVSLVDYDKNVADYLIEVSTEFLTKKIQSDYDQLKNNEFLTPFMRNIDINREKISTILSYVKCIEELKTKIESIFSMLNNKSSFLKQTLQQSIFFRDFSTKLGFNGIDSNLDAIIISHQYINSMISSTYLPNTLNTMINDINAPIAGLSKLYNFDNFLQLLDNNEIFNNINRKFSNIVSDILDNFVKLIPIYLKNDLSTVDLKEYGLNTIDVEDVLSIYKKCYEFIGEYCIIPIGLNNIVERGDCDHFKTKTENIYELLNKINSKYNRLKDYLLHDEKFSYLFDNILNNVIRNSEAHFDYTFNPISQIISFKDKQKNIDLYLVEMVKELLNIYQKVVYIWEMSYCLNKLYLIRIKNELISISPKLLN